MILLFSQEETQRVLQRFQNIITCAEASRGGGNYLYSYI